MNLDCVPPAESRPLCSSSSLFLQNGLIPKFDAAGNLSPTGRTYKLQIDDEVLLAKKRDDVKVELGKCPKVQEYLLDLIKSGKYLENAQGEEISEGQEDDYESMTDDEFLNNLTSSDRHHQSLWVRLSLCRLHPDG